MYSLLMVVVRGPGLRWNVEYLAYVSCESKEIVQHSFPFSDPVCDLQAIFLAQIKCYKLSVLRTQSQSRI